MAKKKEIGKRKPELQEILNKLEDYREELFENPKVGSMKFSHMQTALHWAKQIVRKCYDATPEKNAKAWVK